MLPFLKRYLAMQRKRPYHQLFYASCTLYTSTVTQTVSVYKSYVANSCRRSYSPAVRMSAGEDNNPTSGKESVVVIRCENTLHYASSEIDFTCLVFRGSRCRFVRCVGGSIGCFIVVRLYSRRYCRVGVRNARQISRVGRRVAFGET